MKVTKRAHAIKGFASSYNIEILKCFNPELQLKDNETAIKSELKKLITKSRLFKFLKTLVLVLNKIENEDKKLWHILIPFKLLMKELLMEVTLMIYLNQSIIDSVIENNVNISKHNLLTASSYVKLPKERNA